MNGMDSDYLTKYNRNTKENVESKKKNSRAYSIINPNANISI